MNRDDEEEKRSLIEEVASYGSVEESQLTASREQVRATRMTLRSLYFTMFTGSISFSIVMSSIWPYLKKIDDSVDETFFGIVNAVFSLAQLITSIIFGYWCDRRSSKEPIYLSLFLMLTGCMIYAYAETLGKHGIWMVMGGRIFLGMSAGNNAVARTVGAHLTTNTERTKVLAYLSLFQGVGFIVGPALQAATIPISKAGYYVSFLRLHIDIYTAPCFLMVLLGLVNFALIFCYFNEKSADKKLHQDNKKRYRKRSLSFAPLDSCALVVCLVLWFVIMSVFALNEALLSPLLMNQYGWSRDKTTLWGAVLLSASGIVSVFLFFVAAPLAKIFTERKVMLISFATLLVGFITYLPWGPGRPPVITPANSTALGGGGCPSSYPWCLDAPQLPFAQFIVGATLVGSGFPMGVTMLNVIYSKIVGPFPQGRYMGWLSGVGCLARVAGPVYVTAMYEHFGIRWTAASLSTMLLFVIVLIAIYWRRFTPYKARHTLDDIPGVIQS